MKYSKANAGKADLLAEFLQIGDDTVAEAAVHVVRNKIWSSHHSQGLL